jgi:nicotinamidase-related amidase
MQTVLEACRAKGLQVLHLRTAGPLPDGRDLSRKLKTQGLHLGQGNSEAEIMPEVMPRAGEIVRDKPASGIFTGTGLDELLRNLELDTLIMAGISFDGAVESSIRSATDRGYGVILVPSACAACTESSQHRLNRLESGIIRVKSLARIVEELSSPKETDDGGGC